jgi:hypothetical protein
MQSKNTKDQKIKNVISRVEYKFEIFDQKLSKTLFQSIGQIGINLLAISQKCPKYSIVVGPGSNNDRKQNLKLEILLDLFNIKWQSFKVLQVLTVQSTTGIPGSFSKFQSALIDGDVEIIEIFFSETISTVAPPGVIFHVKEKDLKKARKILISVSST